VDNKGTENKFMQSVQAFMKRIGNDKKFAAIAIGVAVVVIIAIVIGVVAVSGLGKSEDVTEGEVVEESVTSEEAAQEPEETVSGENTEAVADVSLLPEVAFEDDGSLQENAYEDVNALVNQYFAALASGDRNTVAALKSDTTEEELIKIEKKSAYIEAFENITVYTKLGNGDKTYIAFVYYDINFKDVETLAPGLSTLYVCPNAEGALHIFDGELDEAASNRIKEAAAENDVVDLFNRVDVSYSEAMEADAALKTFMEELPAKLDAEVATALAEAEKPAEEPQEAVEASAEAESTVKTETVVATDTVNVRSSDSENADKLGKIDVGTQVTRYEAKGNGWSRIDFNGQEGYVKSEYLSVVEEATVDAGNTETEEEAPAEDPSSVQTQGKITIKETVNVRKSASENGERIGTAYQNENYDLIMEQADGWTKILFNGVVGYVKSEFVEKL